MQSFVWFLAHEKKLPNVIRDRSYKEAKTKKEGTFVPTPCDDALVQALGKLDRDEHVKGFSRINVGIKQSFGKLDRKE